MIQYDMSAIRLMPDGPEQQCGAVREKKECHMKSKSVLQLLIVFLAVMLTLFSFTACDDNPNAPLKRARTQKTIRP